MVPPLPPKKTTRNFNSFRQGCATREHSQAENDQRNGFPVRPRRRKLADTYPSLTNVYFRWPRLSSPSFPLFLPVSRALSFFHRPKGAKPVLEHSTPRENPIEFPGPRFIRLSHHTTAFTFMKPGETKPGGWWRTMGQGGGGIPRKEGND